ncbi:MAG: flagellar brake protein [Lachnospiraceae bacterium]|nr:flagellar brake protein [Lachnospiraceae bacterium]
MLSKYVVPGNKVEMQAVERAKYIDDAEKKKVYQTQVCDILSEDQLEIYMPMEKSKLILLPVNAEYDLYFYTQAGLYQCFANVIDRYKSDNQFILVMELTSNLRKFQRREYYRLSCALEMNSRPLEKEEVEVVERGNSFLVPGLPLKRSVIVDISGGGIRFIGNYAYEPESLVYCKYNLVVDGNAKEYTLVAKVLMVRELEDRPGVYEHRAQYINIDTSEREEIIRFIFEEERKHRKREKGL